MQILYVMHRYNITYRLIINIRMEKGKSSLSSCPQILPIFIWQTLRTLQTFELLRTLQTFEYILSFPSQIQYHIPVDYKYPYGKGKIISKEEKVQFSIPEGMEEIVVGSIRELYEQCLERYYQLLDEYAIQLKNTP